MLSVRAALDHHLKLLPHNKKFSAATTVYLFSEANKGLNSYLKQLISEGNLKSLLTSEAINKKLCDKVPSLTLTCDPHVLHQTAWFISICFGKQVGKTRSQCFVSMKRQLKNTDILLEACAVYRLSM